VAIDAPDDLDPIAESVRPGGRGNRTPPPPKSPWEWEDFPEFVPFLDSTPARPDRLDRYAPFLKHLATHGEKLAACMYARIGKATLYEYCDADPAFAAEVDTALAYYRGRVEAGLVHNSRVTGNPVGYIVRNKAEQPAKYIERHAIVNLSVSAEVSGDDASTLLRELMGSMSDSTRQLLEHGALPQLPAAADRDGDAP
jgi:hypothetical protein